MPSISKIKVGTTSYDVKDSNAVKGPSSSTDGKLVAFDKTTGKLIKDSGLLASDVATKNYVDTAIGNAIAASY